MNWPVADFAMAMLLAMMIDIAIGWPDAVYKRIGHPVTWIGKLISALETRLNQHGGRRFKGAITALVVTGVTATITLLITLYLPDSWWGILLTAVLAWPFIATRSMHQHITAVIKPLEAENIDDARKAISMIVGRDPNQLDENGIARAGLESLAENTSDGIIAPVFWGALLGLPGIAAYKAINTLDSMIGYRNERYEHFGWASARIDDLVNLIPARLSGALYALVSGKPKHALSVMVREAHKHRSPNAGWPEAALAAALDVKLSGPRIYDSKPSQEPWVNEAGQDVKPHHLRLGLSLFAKLIAATMILLAMIAIIGWLA